MNFFKCIIIISVIVTFAIKGQDIAKNPTKVVNKTIEHFVDTLGLNDNYTLYIDKKIDKYSGTSIQSDFSNDNSITLNITVNSNYPKDQLRFVTGHECSHLAYMINPLTQSYYVQARMLEINRLANSNMFCQENIMYYSGVLSYGLLGMALIGASSSNNQSLAAKLAVGGAAILAGRYIKHTYFPPKDITLYHKEELFCDTLSVLVNNNIDSGVQWCNRTQKAHQNKAFYNPLALTLTHSNHPAPVVRKKNLLLLEKALKHKPWDRNKNLVKFALDWVEKEYPTL